MEYDHNRNKYDEAECIQEDLNRSVPMCCGTPLRDDKCIVCGSDYSNHDEEVKEVKWVFIDSNKKIVEQLNKTVEVMNKIISEADSIKTQAQSMLNFVEYKNKLRLWDANEFTTDMAFISDTIEEALTELYNNYNELDEVTTEKMIERKKKNLPHFKE